MPSPIRSNKVDQMTTHTINLSGRKITGAGDATNSTDYTTLQQITALIKTVNDGITDTVNTVKAWVLKQLPPKAIRLSVLSTGALSLTTGYQTITGMSLTLNRKGVWDISVYICVASDYRDQSKLIQLVFDGTAITTNVLEVLTSTGNNIDIFFQTMSWEVTSITGVEVILVQAKKLGGSGTSTAGNVGISALSKSVVVARWISE